MVVKESGGIPAALTRCILEDGANGSIESISRDGGGMDSHIRVHIEDGTVEHEIICECGYLIPVVTDDQASVDETIRREGCGGVESTEWARSSRAWLLCSCTERESFTGWVVVSIALEECCDVLPGTLEESLEIGPIDCGVLGDIVGKSLNPQQSLG